MLRYYFVAFIAVFLFAALLVGFIAKDSVKAISQAGTSSGNNSVEEMLDQRLGQ